MWQNTRDNIRSIILFTGSIVFRNRDSKVIYYHDIHASPNRRYTNMSTKRQLFEKHILTIKERGFRIVTEISKNKNEIAIHFDDGFRGIYENLDLFIQYDVKATVFIITSRIGTPNYLSLQEIRELHHLGFNIQSHTVNHLNLTELEHDKVISEIRKSREILGMILSTTIYEISFPRGFFCENILNACIEEGYTRCYCSIPGRFYSSVMNTGATRRNLVQFSSARQLDMIISGGSELLSFLYLRKQMK